MTTLLKFLEKDFYLLHFYIYISKYWKNGSSVDLSSGESYAYAYSVFVTKEQVK